MSAKRGLTKGRYSNPHDSRNNGMMEDDPGQDEVRESYTTKGGTLDDSDWNTRSKSERQFIIRMDCHDRAVIREEQCKIEDEKDIRPRVFESRFLINT